MLEKKKATPEGVAFYLVVKEGLEPSTPGLWILCSNQLSYITMKLLNFSKGAILVV